MTLQAIETRYKGYRFRSRLEARWAVFFDALSVRWEYEREGYNLGSAGWYLPDFWLPMNWWVEVKGQQPTRDELHKAAVLTDLSRVGSCMIVSGTPGDEQCYLPDINPKTKAVNWIVTPEKEERGIKSWWLWCELTLSCHSHDQVRIPNCPLVEQAYVAARSARFEHGERGAIRWS